MNEGVFEKLAFIKPFSEIVDRRKVVFAPVLFAGTGRSCRMRYRQAQRSVLPDQGRQKRRFSGAGRGGNGE